MCTKFRFDWSTGSNEKDRFSKSRFKALVSKFGESRKKVNLSESGSRDWADQIVWNFDTFEINILTQCVPSFDLIGRLDQMKKTVYQRVVWKRSLSKSWAKVGKRSIFRKAFLGIEPNQIVWHFDIFKINILTQCVPSFDSDWSTGSNEKDSFSKSRFKALVVKVLGESRKKVNLSESGSRDWADQIVWNFNTFKINILTQCVPSFDSDWSTGSNEKDRFSKSRFKALVSKFGESRKKVNLSESGSRDWADQIVWNFDTFKINILTQCVPSFDSDWSTGSNEKDRFSKSRFKALVSKFGESRKKVNISESGSRDWADQIVWNFDTFKINILTQCVPSFDSDWSTGSNEKDRFSKSRFKALVSKFGESRKKVNLSESGSRDWADQIVWNFDTFKINILTQCVPSFDSDWSTGSNEKDRFSKSRFKALVSKFGESRKKVNLSESGSRDWADQIVWNFDTFKINILTQCVPSFEVDWIKWKRPFFKESFESARCRILGESRKKVNLSESSSRDWADQIVWNFDTFKINILTQCVPSFDSIGRLDQMRQFVQRVVWGAVVESWAKVGKRSIFRKAVLGIEQTKLFQILTPLRSIS